KLINDYRQADLILFVGGGSLRSQKGLAQSLNLLMIVFVYKFAKLFKSRIIVTPISFGPFAYKWQEKYSARTLKDLYLVSAREKYSYDILQKYKVNNLLLSTDYALLLNRKITKKSKSHKFILGFTLRRWLPKDKQLKFENYCAEAI